jgi:hypothetical protein
MFSRSIVTVPLVTQLCNLLGLYPMIVWEPNISKLISRSVGKDIADSLLAERMRVMDVKDGVCYIAGARTYTGLLNRSRARQAQSSLAVLPFCAITRMNTI